MTERKYPCQARIKPSSDYRDARMSGALVTVLTEHKYWDCCCQSAHAIEFPEGFPDPPGNCAYWTAPPESLEFIEEGGPQ